MSWFPDNQKLNMTEVIYPSQVTDTRAPDYPAPSAEWFLPSSVLSNSSTNRISISQAQDAGTSHAALSATPPNRAASRSSNRTPFPSGAFAGLGNSMSQHSNPFDHSTSQPLQQPTLQSSVTNTPPSSHLSNPRAFTPIAPDPVGLQRIQASRINEDQQNVNEGYPQTRKRKNTGSSMDAPAPPPLRDEDKLLLHLKDEQQLPWKDIAQRFRTETGKVYMIPALQMRYKRLKERLQVWTDADVEALRQAHEYWESRKFDIISAKMLEFGATDKFSPRACQRKWQDMHPAGEYPPQQHPNFPPQAFSQSASPQPMQPMQPMQPRAPQYSMPTSAYHPQSYPQPTQHLPPPPSYVSTSQPQTLAAYGAGNHGQGQGPSVFPGSQHRMGSYPPTTNHGASGYYS